MGNDRSKARQISASSRPAAKHPLTSGLPDVKQPPARPVALRRRLRKPGSLREQKVVSQDKNALQCRCGRCPGKLTPCNFLVGISPLTIRDAKATVLVISTRPAEARKQEHRGT